MKQFKAIFIYSMPKCEHGRQKQQCKDCGGSQLCNHNRYKSQCKDCGGSNICLHNRYKPACKECKGSQICEHEQRRSRCKQCKGTSICEHDRQRSACRQCGGKSICEHGKYKQVCRECNGISICEHDKRKTLCKDCCGSQICKHNKQKAYCKECCGSQICKHNKQKVYCKECDGRRCCKGDGCEKLTTNPRYQGYCLSCCLHYCPNIQVARNYKTKEKATSDYIREKNPDVDILVDHRVPDGCSKRRPDIIFDFGDQVIMVEVDENMHEDYDCSCETRRLMELSQDIGHRPLVVLRFNPDGYIKRDGKKEPSCWILGRDGILRIRDVKVWELRLAMLQERIEYWKTNRTEKTLEVEQLFFDEN